MKRLGRALLLLWVLLFRGPPAESAPRPHYGGEVVLHVFGPPLSLNPHLAPTSADRTVQAALFEPLYRLGPDDSLEPVLASGPPEIDGKRVFIPLRQGVRLHDGQLLTPQRAAQSLQSKLHSSGAHVLTPVAGFYEAYAGRGNLGLTADGPRHGLRFELLEPYEGFVRLLTCSHAAITVPSDRAQREVGTGPFTLERRSARGGVHLVAFVEHWRGRPYLDRVVFRIQASRSNASAWARRAEPSWLFGVPDARGIRPETLHWPDAASSPAPLSRRVLRLPQGVPPQAIEAALGRERLVRRFMDGEAQPTSRLLGSGPATNAPPDGRGLQALSARLVVSQSDRPSWPFAQRVQLDLLRVGVSVTLERVDGDELQAKLQSPGADIVLGALLSDAPHTDDPIDGLHALLSMSASLGAPDTITEAELRAFLLADTASRQARLPQLEQALRDRLGLVVIAVRAPGLMVKDDLSGWSIDSRGAVRLDEAQRPEASP